MATLSYAQLRAYAAAAGAANPDVAAAVAMAESGGSTTAHNAVPPDNSYGLWQINMYGSMGPARRKQFGLSSNAQLTDPATNARAMVVISSGGTNFSPWTTYSSGKYKKFLQGADTTTTNTPAVDAGFTATNANAITDIPGEMWDGIKNATEVVVDAANWIVNPSNWLRVAYVIGGVSVALVGLAILLEKPIMGVKGSAAKAAAMVA